MSDTKQLLKTKAQIRSIRPRFMRQKGNLKKRISRSSYRAPKGLQSKMGDNKAGHRSQIKTGFGYPKDVRGLDMSGRKIIMIQNVAQANSIDVANSVAVVASTLGQKKRIEIVKILSQKNVPMRNIKDAAKFLVDAQAAHKQTKEEKAKEAKARAERKENALKHKQGKKVDEAKNAASAMTPEQAIAAKEAEKKEQDKILTQKQQ